MRSILVLAVALAGCSNHATSIDRDRVVTTLTKDEFATYCSDYDSWARKNRVPLIDRYRCVLDAVDPDNNRGGSSDLDAQERCRKYRDACVAKPFPESIPVDCASLAKRYEGCDRVTMGEIDDCLRENLDDTKADLEKDYCLAVRKDFTTDDYIKFIHGLKHVGPKCQSVRDKCPSFAY